MDTKEQLRRAGTHFQKVRKEKLRATQIEAANIVGIGYRTLQNIESGISSTSFYNILKVLQGFGCSDLDVLTICGYLDYDLGASHDPSEPHRKRLDRYATEHYSFYFVNAVTEKIQRLTVELGEIIGYSYVGGTGKINEQQYGCKLISPPDGEYTYLYFSSSLPLVDRAVFVLPYHANEIIFGAGTGIMLSISNEAPRSPTVQRFIVINDRLGHTDNSSDTYLLNNLKLKSVVSDYAFRFPQLITESISLASQFVRLDKHIQREIQEQK